METTDSDIGCLYFFRERDNYTDRNGAAKATNLKNNILTSTYNKLRKNDLNPPYHRIIGKLFAGMSQHVKGWMER